MAQTVNFAPIRNPANKDRVFIYRVAPSVQTLGYDQRTIGQVSNTTRWNKDPTMLPSTRLQATSNIVALDFDDVVHVYGVAQDSNLVTLISPFTEQLGPNTKAPKGALAGCVQKDGGVVTKVWLAYQAGTDGNPIMWCDVTDAEAQDSPSTAEGQAAGTALSAFFDTKRFWLIYQDTKGRLTSHNEKDQQATRIFGDSAFFIKSSPIGSCFIPKYKEGTLGRAIVYWVRKVNDSNVLYRSHADITDEATASWTDPKPATSAGQNVQSAAQIGIIVDEAKQSNIIYLSKEGGKDNITPVTDSWKAKEWEEFQKWKAQRRAHNEKKEDQKEEIREEKREAGTHVSRLSSGWAEAEVEVVIPAGTVMTGDIKIKLKLRTLQQQHEA